MRLQTPFQQINLAPDESGSPDTAFPWVLDLRTLEGYQGFDIGMAALFRITQWQVEGTIEATLSGVDEEDVFSETRNAAITTAIIFGDERDFAAIGTLEEEFRPVPFNARLEIDVSSSNSFDFGAPGGPRIVGTTGFLPFRFQWIGADTGLIARSQGDGSPTAPEIGSITVRVPSWTGGAWHQLTTPLFNFGAIPVGTTNPSAEFTITGIQSLRYTDSNLEDVWNGDATPFQDPVLAHVEIP